MKVLFVSLLITFLSAAAPLGARSQLHHQNSVFFEKVKQYSFWQFSNLVDTVSDGKSILFNITPSGSKLVFFDPVLQRVVAANEIDISRFKPIQFLSPFADVSFSDGGSIRIVDEEPPPACENVVGVHYVFIKNARDSPKALYIVSRHRPPEHTRYCGAPLNLVFDVSRELVVARLLDGEFLIVDYTNQTAVAFMRPPEDAIISFADLLYLLPEAPLKHRLDAAGSSQRKRYETLTKFFTQRKIVSIEVNRGSELRKNLVSP